MDAITKKLGGIKNQILQISEIEAKVLEATSNEKWGASGTLKLEIARATRNSTECKLIMTTIWKRLTDSGKNWRHVYKGLQLLEYLITHGDDRVCEEARDALFTIRSLNSFQYVDEKGKDHGLSVRHLSKTIVTMLEKPEILTEERQKARQSVGKYEGFSSSDAKALVFSRRGSSHTNERRTFSTTTATASSSFHRATDPVPEDDRFDDNFDGNEPLDDEPPATSSSIPASSASTQPVPAPQLSKPRRPSNAHSRPPADSAPSMSHEPPTTTAASQQQQQQQQQSQVPKIQSLTSFFQDAPPVAAPSTSAPLSSAQDPFGVAPPTDVDWAEFESSATPTSMHKYFGFEDDDDFGKQATPQQQQQQHQQSQQNGSSTSSWGIPSNLVNLDSLSIVSKESDEPQRKVTLNEKMRQMGISQRPVAPTPMHPQKPSPTHASVMISPTAQGVPFAQGPPVTNYVSAISPPHNLNQQQQPLVRGPALSPPSMMMMMNPAPMGSPYAANPYAQVARPPPQTRSPPQF